MIDDAARSQIAQEIADLIDRDGVTGARIHAAALVAIEMRPLMPISSPAALNRGPPELPGFTEASTCRQSVYSRIVLAGY